MTIEMHNPEAQIMRELTDPQHRGIHQVSVAITYAYVITQCGKTADWPTINAAIRRRWKGQSTLGRIKRLAWNQVEKWRGDLVGSIADAILEAVRQTREDCAAELAAEADADPRDRDTTYRYVLKSAAAKLREGKA